jgi:hypothetical protein
MQNASKMIKIDKNEAKKAYFEKSTLSRKNILPENLLELHPWDASLILLSLASSPKIFDVQLLQICLNVLSTEPRQRQAAIGHTSDKSLRCKV